MLRLKSYPLLRAERSSLGAGVRCPAGAHFRVWTRDRPRGQASSPQQLQSRPRAQQSLGPSGAERKSEGGAGRRDQPGEQSPQEGPRQWPWAEGSYGTGTHSVL